MVQTADKARSLFLAAIEGYVPEQWPAYLDGACGEDGPLRDRVEHLLEAHRALGPFAMPEGRDVSATIEVAAAEGLGTTIGPYRLLEVIGEGGMGTVYMAEQARPVRRKVALKLIKPGMDSRQVVARFEAERQALALMEHPNIAKVHDAGTTEQGRPYFVMELVNGIPITDYCDRARLTVSERLDLFVLVCRAVQHAHQKGVIHRDLKPSNILVTLIDGAAVPKVIDFGVAKAIEGRPGEGTLLTGFAQMIGTPLYMSPEQAELSGVDADTRSDVYALGVLLYELLTGTTPIDRETLCKAVYDEIRRVIREHEPPTPSTRLGSLGLTLSTVSSNRHSDPRKLSLAVRGELDWIVMKALEKDRARRYETANDFAADVMNYLTDRPVEACPPSASYRLRKFARRNKVVLTTAALVVAALFIGTVVSTWQAVRATQAEGRTDIQRKLAERSAAEAQRQTTEARKAQGDALRAQSDALRAKQEAERQRNAVSRNLYYADMRLGLVDWTAGNIGRLSSKLFSHVPHVDGEDHRDWEWYYLLSLSHQDERSLMQHIGPVNSVGWSPDGRRFASTGSDGMVAVYDTATWQIVRTWWGENVWGGHWSPDSQRLAWTTTNPDNGFYVGRVETGEKLTLLGHMSSGRAPAWSPDGKHVASRGSSGIRLWDPATGSSIGVLDGVGNVGPMVWDPGGKLLVWARASQELKTWDAVSGEGSRAIPSMTGMISAAWSPDGKQLSLGLETGKCLVYKTADWSVAREWNAHTGPVNSVVWHPDGSQFASAGADHLIQVWDPATGKNLLTIRGHVNQVISLAWEPNGRRLASAGMDGLVRVWPLPPVMHPRRLEAHAGGVGAMAWSEDGENLRSFGAADGTIALWDVVNGQPLSKLPVPGGASAQFSPGGRLLAIATNDVKHPEILIRNARSGELVQTVKKSTVPAAFSAFSPDASKLALSNGSTVEIVDLRQDEVQVRWEIKEPHALAWSPDGRLLAAVGRGDMISDANGAHGAWVHLFDINKRQRVFKMQHGESWVPATALTWSPDGQRLVAGGFNGLVEVWEIPTGHKVASVDLHTGAVKALAWSPNGRRVASGSGDGIVRVWDPVRGEELLKLDAPKSDVTHLEWSPNGRRLAGATADGAILIWDATTGHEFAHGEAYAFELVHHSLIQGSQLWEAGRKNEAIALYEQTLEENKSKLGSFPRWVGMSIRRDARTANSTGQDQETIELCQLLARLNKDESPHYGLGEAFARQGRWDEAIASYREGIRLKDDFIGPNNLALILATCADPKFRDIPQALQLARQAVKLAPSDSECWNTLGVCLYRAGDWESTIEALEKARGLGHRGESFDSFFLAMAHGQLGDKQKARTWYHQAVQWMDKNKPQDAELRRLRAEAGELLGINAKQDR